MKQVIQNVCNGKLELVTPPDPIVQAGHVLIANRFSVISAGTEKMVRELAQKSLFGKARERPDHVRRVLQKARSEGLWNTIQQVREKLDQPMPMGYCSAGVVLACGDGVQEYQPGDLLASNGPHAEIVCTPKNLCARVPDGVPLDQAAFTVLGAIAIQGVRLSRSALGETALVIGLGLIGQITVALLKAAGVRVIGTDLDAAKCELARRTGAEVARPGVGAKDVLAITGDLGADAVLITASTKSNAPIDLAANAVRQKGRVVLVGVVGLELDRRPFYFKEAEFVVSCSYGPGRYDPRYEEGGHDYPPAHVRWTEQRNMQAVLDLMAAGELDLGPLISHRFSLNEATKAYELIESGSEPYLGIVLEYPRSDSVGETRTIELQQPGAGTEKGSDPVCRNGPEGAAHKRGLTPFPRHRTGSGPLNVGCLGAGNFARAVLLPKLCSIAGVSPAVLCSAGGVSAAHTGKKLGFARATSDEAEVFADTTVDAVFVITRHDLHARQVIEGIRAGKHVFVEKPLCLTIEELAEIEGELFAWRGSWPARETEDTGEQSEGRPAVGDHGGVGRPAPSLDRPGLVMVGFNRRFSSAAVAVKRFFHGEREKGVRPHLPKRPGGCCAQMGSDPFFAPLTASIRFNAGAIPADHWTQDEAIGGGRIIGEACHAIDLATYLIGSPPVRVFAESIGGPDAPVTTDDQCFITLWHSNGSISNIAYLAGGDKACPKERIEVIGDGKVAVIDDFRSAVGWSGGKRKRLWRGTLDKGHTAELNAFVQAVAGGGGIPIKWAELRATTLASILAVRSLREGMPVDVPLWSSRVATDVRAA